MDREPHELEDRQQIERLLRQRAEIGERFVKQVDDLGATAEELALVEGALRAARTRLGRHQLGPSGIELMTSVLLGRLGKALRPEIPFVTSGAGEQAATLLCTPHQLGMSIDDGSRGPSVAATTFVSEPGPTDERRG